MIYMFREFSFFWNSQKKKDKIIGEWRCTLRVLRAKTWLTVYRTIAYQNSSYAGQSGAAHAGARDHKNVV